MYQQLIAQITPDTIVLTANRRLSTHIRYYYEKNQIAQGQSVWIKAQILPLPSWLETMWQSAVQQNLITHQWIVSDLQAKLILQTIIADDTEAPDLLNLEGSADLALKAYQFIQAWQIPLTAPEFQQKHDHQCFQRWAKQLQQQLHEKNAMLFCDIPLQLQTALPGNETFLPKKIILVGFDNLPPNQTNLLSCLESLGTTVLHYRTTRENTSTVKQLPARDIDEELSAMVAYAIQTACADQNALVACVVPNLTQIRAQVVKAFTTATEGDANAPHYNVGAGTSFLQLPIIDILLILLDGLHQAWSMVEISKLLRTPFIGEGNNEGFSRAELDRALRTQVTHRLRLNTFAYKHARKTPKLQKRLDQLIKFMETINKNALPSSWLEHFNQALNIMGWPGERELSSEEYQIVQRLFAAFDEFCGLDSIVGEINCQTALKHLRQLLSGIIFQGQTDHTPIQVLGTLEAFGMEFDALWVMGVDDQQFPMISKPNPFIPYRLQATFDLPHATPEREFRYAKTLLETFAISSPQVIFSFARTDLERSSAPSPFIKSFPVVTVSDLALTFTSPTRLQLYEFSDLETINDAWVEPLPANKKMQGGSYLLKHQAACPFRATALFRLHAESVTMSDPGLSKIDRGTLTHFCLDALWCELKDQQTLINMSSDLLENLIRHTVTTCMNAFLSARPNLNDSRYIALEKERLQRLLLDWLALEKTRNPFRVVATEKRITITLADMELALQVDRIDELEFGEQIIIDYKTGTPSINAWFGERLEDPQLPLYCLSSETNIEALVFAVVNQQHMGFRGISKKPLAIAGVLSLEACKNAEKAAGWDEQIDAWRSAIHVLADEYKSGVALINPLHGSKTCMYCELQPLCRIAEKTHD